MAYITNYQLLKNTQALSQKKIYIILTFFPL